jgi:hypothetical protein
MELPSYFRDFLADIRPTSNHVQDYQCGHRTLRQRLADDPALSPLLVCTFLQGSYRRSTAIRPKGGKRADVDVIAVTRFSEAEYTPTQAFAVFEPFLEKYYKGKWRPQGRSFGIELSYVELDLVITSAPSESEMGILQAASVIADTTPEETDDWRLVKSWLPLDQRATPLAQMLLKAARAEAEWKLSPLRIPDRDAERWEDTHPLAQIQWTWDKNRRCNGHYVNVVKALKWHRRVQYPSPEHPKGYPLEHLIGVCCPDGITSVAEGVTRTLEQIASAYGGYAAAQLTPFLADHGVPTHNVLHRISGADFAAFHTQACEAAEIARRALDAGSVRESALAWRELFGTTFPAPPDDQGETQSGGYSPRKEVSIIGGGRFA